MLDTESIESKIREFVLNHFPLARKMGLKPEDKWLENGLVDSLGILDLVHFLEKEFKIQASDDELAPENFESLCSVAEFTRRKVASLTQVNG